MPRFIAFDFGLRRIGVASGQTITGTANPLNTVHHQAKVTEDRIDSDAMWTTIASIIKEWQPDGLVVGIPLTMAGEEQPITHAARTFAEGLERFNLPIHHADERLSSREADSLFKQARQQGQVKRSKAKNLDSVAAKVILERWLAAQN